jgi:hypothetical protein
MFQTRYALLFSLTSRKLVLLLCLLFFFATLVQAQQQTENDEDRVIRDLIENMAADLPEDYDLSELTETLTYLHKHPLNLNKATPEALKALVFLSSLQISNLIEHIQANGKFIDLLELQAVDGFDVQTVQRIMPFVTISDASKQQYGLSNLIHQSEQQLLLRYGQTLEKQRGFEALPGSRYLGSPERLLAKYKYNYKDQVTANLVLEKDAGEYLYAKAQGKGPDFFSGNVTVYRTGIINKLVVGDYSLQFGQGLTLWTGFGFGKGPDVTSVAKKDVGLKPYSSSNESSYLRGLATTIRVYERLELTSFVSRTQQDASTKVDEDGHVTQINIGISGLHRTPSELKNRNALRQTIYGSALQYNSDNLTLGVVGYKSEYSNSFVTGPLAYNQYNFTGQQLFNTGIHYNYTFQNIYFYGETAKSFPGGVAMVNGAMASLSRSVSVVVVNRNYGKDHHNFLARSLGESSDASNESGWYAGMNFVPSKRWSFSLYGDAFKFPGLKYRIDQGSCGYELLSQAVYSPTKTFKVVIRAKTQQKQQNAAVKEDSTIRNVNQSNYRIAVNWSLTKTLAFENRFEVVNYKKESINELGFLLYQDVNYRPSASKLSGNMRVAVFHTASYNSRLYAYEDDVLYSSGFGMYNGKGLRTYLNLQYKLSKKLHVWARYAIFLYKDLETVGSGLDLIQGNKKMDLKFQLRYNL